MNTNKKIYVYFHHNREIPELFGVLSVQVVRGKELVSFEFDKDWLKNNPTPMIDPDLELYSGPQFTTKSNFGIFLDSSPDCWGRRLIMRREKIRANKEGRPPINLQESDFLLGVYDETKMGALRFKTQLEGNFFNDDADIAAPPWTRLRELEEACRHIDDDNFKNEHEKWLSMLVAPCSSLGGARPKAAVWAPDKSLWIAKFPSHNDLSNISAWEFLTMQMAKDCGINVPECKLEHFSKFGSTFLVKRFDRLEDKRIHFSSAMTLLGKTDSANAQDCSSYLELAEFITSYGAAPDIDLYELWKRIVFSIAVSNTDDHLRNHGFLLTQNGWRLSPAYDINPNPLGNGLSLNISDCDNSLDFSLALEVAPFFRLSKNEAEKILKNIIEVVPKWKDYASTIGISRSEQEEMQQAFRWK